VSLVVDYVRQNRPDSARYLIQANPAGGVRIIPIAVAPVQHQPNAANDAQAEQHLDGFYPQPPWAKVTTVLPALPQTQPGAGTAGT
jgi:hypothetical protein